MRKVLSLTLTKLYTNAVFPLKNRSVRSLLANSDVCFSVDLKAGKVNTKTHPSSRRKITVYENTFVFINRFILVRSTVDLEYIPMNTGDSNPSQCNMHTQRNSVANPPSMFLETHNDSNLRSGLNQGPRSWSGIGVVKIQKKKKHLKNHQFRDCLSIHFFITCNNQRTKHVDLIVSRYGCANFRTQL